MQFVPAISSQCLGVSEIRGLKRNPFVLMLALLWCVRKGAGGAFRSILLQSSTPGAVQMWELWECGALGFVLVLYSSL